MNMSMSPSAVRRRSLWGRSFRQVLPLALAVTLAGCGGGKSDVSDTSDATDSSTGGEAVVVTETAPESESGVTQPIPSADTGIQLPDQAVPTGDGTDGSKEPGPAQPGGGGLEMPDLNPPSPGESTSQSGQDASDVPLEYASWSEIERRATSTGKITVVDLWSTVCAPCIEEFPGLVRLSKAMPDAVTCIGVSVDYDGRKSRPPEYYRDKVGSFLTSVDAQFDNYLCNTPSDDVFATVGLPSIPAVLIYDADGKLVKQFVDAGDTVGFSYESDIVPFVEKLAG